MHKHTCTSQPFIPRCRPALPGTKNLAEPGMERVGPGKMFPRVCGNPGLVNTPLSDLIRPLPGQRQAGQEVDNGQNWTALDTETSAHPGTSSSCWNKQSSTRQGREERLHFSLLEMTQHQQASPQNQPLSRSHPQNETQRPPLLGTVSMSLCPITSSSCQLSWQLGGPV